MSKFKKYFQIAAVIITAGLSIYDIENIDRYLLGLTTVLGFLETVKLKGDLDTMEQNYLNSIEANVFMTTENERLTKKIGNLNDKLKTIKANAEASKEADKPATKKRATKKKAE